MPADLTELLRATAPSPVRALDVAEVACQVRRRRHRRRRVATALTAVAGVVAIAVVVNLLDPLRDPAAPDIVGVPPEDAVEQPTEPQDPLAQVTPSQSPQDAARDGVVGEVAALPFELRVEDPWLRIVTDEGVWVVSRLSREVAELAEGCALGDTGPDAVYGRDVICDVEYGEVLLLNSDETQILRAFPFPGSPPQELAVSDEAVYCTRQGDGALSHSMLCRIDRANSARTVRLFTPDADALTSWLPVEQLFGDWSVDTSAADATFGELITAGAHLLALGWDGQVTPVDPDTLALLDPDDLDISRSIGEVLAADPAAGTITIRPIEWLSGEEARRAYEEDTGDPDGPPNDYYIPETDHTPINYPVATDVEARMTFLWDAGCCPEHTQRPLDWHSFARIWTDEATRHYDEADISYARAAYYWLVVVDGEVVRITQQYQP